MKPVIVAMAFVLLPLTALAEDAPAPAAALPRPVISEIVTADPARARSFPGVLVGENVATLGFLTGGRIASVPVAAGDLVTKGATLATLDEVTLEQDLATARAALDAAEARATLAQQQFERVQTLSERGVASNAVLDDARANRDAMVAGAENTRASLTRAEDAAQYGTLTAPRDGIVLSVMVEPGATVSAGSSVVKLADPKGREAVIDVPDAFAALLPPNAAFNLRRHSNDTATTTARLSVTEPMTDTSLGTRRLRLTLDDPPEDYRIGSLIEASYAEIGAPLMTLPRVAITEGQNGPGVWRVEAPERRVHLLSVTLGAEIGDRVIIREGIAVGDEIVTRGVHILTENQNVGAPLQ
ncbi:Multidrug resistance protein MdtE precursor [Thalassovita gelatinovora]|uniref:Multidrug resistance protein MdtE n=1 Tax=Thalassovita gelatinovora TaxID=53501 RepID=A0A0N7LUV1_THAGE|nr:efflux RND transporter periplasmic adaptor subunit [Thalassovita gelatinovora]QIZ81313.1 efflux RND transporter periplasmic adaptor subunit [Thalassovita gelatinovora]CUH64522.1 Multidrug resistance protein MdtE precursor [Thalassovita gelatinovora]SEP96966.1 RND family efflux transporter, MFP subunit [Thalassovita gelatinovora]